MRRAIEFFWGSIEYRINPKGRAWGGGGPFNGQVKRRELVESLVEHFAIDTVVETGTYYGVTADYFSNVLHLETITIESNSRFAGFSAARLRNTKNANVVVADSRDALRTIIPKLGARNRVLFYLDAHCDNDDLHPLPQELEIIFGLMHNPIVLIDDFAVPFDSGYNFDVYKSGLELKLDFIMQEIIKFNLCVFFPSAPSSGESGPRRGSVMLCHNCDATAMEGVSQARRWHEKVG
jgi:hypothetical protein